MGKIRENSYRNTMVATRKDFDKPLKNCENFAAASLVYKGNFSLTNSMRQTHFTRVGEKFVINLLEETHSSLGSNANLFCKREFVDEGLLFEKGIDCFFVFFPGHTLSVCLKEDLEQLMQEASEGDLNTAKKSLQDSLTSHWQEKGGRNSCYVTRKEDKIISIFTTS